jgi:hypothetical protein
VPPTAPVPVPGRYDARRATRLQYSHLLAEQGYAALSDDDRAWLDVLYWGPVEAWPPVTQIAHHDPLGSEDERALDVPTLGAGMSSVRLAPLLSGRADPEPASVHRFQGFLAFWQWWVAEGHPTLTKAGEIALANEQLRAAPLIKVVPPGREAKTRFLVRLIEEIQSIEIEEEADAAAGSQ